jgi:transcriptional regulator with XRE-family HTH domain
MKTRGITQTELSLRTGIGQSRISEYLSGVRVPEEANRKLLADALGWEEDELMAYIIRQQMQRKRAETPTTEAERF